MKNKHYFEYGIIPALLIGIQTVQGYAFIDEDEQRVRVTTHKLHFLCFMIGWIITEPLNE